MLFGAVVHALNVPRPLGDPPPLPGEAFGPAATFCAKTRWPASLMLGGASRKRIAGVRLVAEDQDWSHGEGPEVRGSGEAMLLLVSGRPVDPGELRGDGAPLILDRLHPDGRGQPRT